MRIALVSLVFGALSYYFFSQGRYILGSLFLFWACLGPLLMGPGQWIAGLSLVNRDYHVERDCNVSLQVGINVEEVLKHPAMDKLFERLRETKILPHADQGAWAPALFDNYKKKYGSQGPWETVRFHIKSNLVWKNGEPDFSDAIWHEIFIPYELAVVAEDRYAPGFPPSLETGLTIRLMVVNGILRLQAGDHSKASSPDSFTGLTGEHELYRARETITSFPLRYCPAQHRIPERYMNFTPAATESYPLSYSASSRDSKKWHSEWKKVRREASKYLYACRIRAEHVPHVIEGPKWMKIIKEFDAKKEEWLKREGFVQPYRNSAAAGTNTGIHYENACLRVVVTDYRDANEKLQKRIASDYIIEEKS